MHLKMSSAKWRPLCLGLTVVTMFAYQYWNGMKLAIMAYAGVSPPRPIMQGLASA